MWLRDLEWCAWISAPVAPQEPNISFAVLKIVSYALWQISFWLNTHSHLSRFCQVKISDSKKTRILQWFCSQHLVFWFLGKFAFLRYEWVLPSTEVISTNNNNWAIMKGEHLNMDVFSVLVLLKKIFYGNQGAITAVKLQFCYIIRSFKKIKSEHNNLELFNIVRNIVSWFWTYTLKMSD